MVLIGEERTLVLAATINSKSGTAIRDLKGLGESLKPWVQALSKLQHVKRKLLSNKTSLEAADVCTRPCDTRHHMEFFLSHFVPRPSLPRLLRGSLGTDNTNQDS